MDAPEPYTVIEVVRGDKRLYEWDGKQVIKVHTVKYYFTVYYRNYAGTKRFTVVAKDELEAFTLGTQRLIKTKNPYDKYGKNKKEQTP